MTMLSELPWVKVKFGMKVLPADHELFGGFGVVTAAVTNILDPQYNHIRVHWANGNVSMWFHHQYSSVEVVKE